MLLFGTAAGLGMLCKIHSAFLWLGLILYILIYKREWLQKPALYFSGLITIAFFYPVIKWNIDNGFITFLYHGKRVNVTNSGISFSDLFTFLGGQVFYLNPIVFACTALALLSSLRNNLPILISHKRILLLTSLPLILVACCIAVFKPVLPHWTGPGYTGLLLLTAAWFTKKRDRQAG